ncbi:MAG: hypothetical protein B7733_21795 [Myxococcales bacterium FL481]|nr:MAG: hypothetical protein B7733_21795 [Myxococcales bacterium FL481]
MLESKYNEFMGAGLQVFVLMGEGLVTQVPPTADELRIWTDEGASFPILNDPLYQHSQEYVGGISLGSALVVGPGVKVAVKPVMDLHGIAPVAP